MSIEEALLQSHCGEPHLAKCEGTIVIRADKTVLACKRCGTETRCHLAHSQPPTNKHEHKKRKKFYEIVLKEIGESLQQ